MGIFNQHSNNQPQQGFLRGLQGSPGVGFNLTKEFNHIDNLVSEDEIKTIKEFYEYCHKQFWCFKKTYKHFKILDESINISGILLMIIGTISGGDYVNYYYQFCENIDSFLLANSLDTNEFYIKVV